MVMLSLALLAGLVWCFCMDAHKGVSHAEIPGMEVLERALAAPAAKRPVPNLGYACLNMALREQRPPIYTNRDCIKKTYDEKGLPWISALALENTRALAAIVQWNWEHDIHFFRCGLLGRSWKAHGCLTSAGCAAFEVSVVEST